jgi:osmotically-inducible protein OsmY
MEAKFLSDAEIRERIEEEIWWSPHVDSDDVQVTVDAGVASLTGTVDSWKERVLARQEAYEGGAADVIDRMKNPDE